MNTKHPSIEFVRSQRSAPDTLEVFRVTAGDVEEHRNYDPNGNQLEAGWYCVERYENGSYGPSISRNEITQLRSINSELLGALQAVCQSYAGDNWMQTLEGSELDQFKCLHNARAVIAKAGGAL